ncbi:MAG TPA: hypothetical protein VHN80_18175 [Kineosporiaceae bacterium]|nr:hypothetical protein [Kineosporiaceae bacterium]
MTRRDLPPRVPVTALRVFEPLEAFAGQQQRLLASFVADPAAGRGADAAERRATWLWLLGHGRHRPEVPARVLRVDGKVLLSPLAVDAPDGQAITAVPGLATTSIGTAGRPDGGSDARSGTGAVPPRCHVLVRAWELPVAWLAVVRQEDLTASGGAGRYVLPMSRARSRAARTLRTLRSGLGDVDVTLDVEGLARWLEHFHPRAWVELDARPVAALVGGQDGADDVQLGLECLTVGDASGVAAAYQRLRRRSRTLHDLSHSS